ncbi:MAG: glycosyltransferase family 4 protein [Terriglobia bacterium]
MHKDSVIVTKNGLDLKYFTEEPKKIGNRLIYSSSPDRGLLRLLELFPQIKAQVPDTELHIYYGFHNWKKMAQMLNNSKELEQIALFENLLEQRSKEGGITYHGRVSKAELAKAFLASKVWSYPTGFTESSCITAMEAQAGGCVPVTTALAALPETVSHGFVLKPPNTTPAYGEAFVRRVVKLLLDEKERAKYADAGREYTFQIHGWDKVAASWEKHFHETLTAKIENPLPAFGNF